MLLAKGEGLDSFLQTPEIGHASLVLATSSHPVRVTKMGCTTLRSQIDSAHLLPLMTASPNWYSVSATSRHLWLPLASRPEPWTEQVPRSLIKPPLSWWV